MKTILSFISFVAFAFASQAQMTWTQIPSGTDKELKTIQFVDNATGFIGGDSILLKTTDGGANWTEVQIDSIPLNSIQTLDIYDMHWFDAQHGIIMSGTWGGMFETFNSGSTWQAVVPANSGFCQFGSVFYFDENNGFAGGAGCFEGHIIDRFENGTWATTMDPPDWNTNNLVVSIEFKDAMTGFAGTTGGTLLRTTDGGFNWDTIPHPVLGQGEITDFSFYGGDTIRATYIGGFGVMISFDNGLTWQDDWETSTFFYPRMEAIHIDGNGITYIGGLETNSSTQGMIFDNSAPFWSYNTIGHRIVDITSHTDSIVFLVGDTGAIYTNVDPSTLNIQDLNQGPTFNLFPNPASNELNITGVEETINSLRVFDLRGRIILQGNGYAINRTIDISDLETGLFILEIETEKGVARNEFVKF